MSRLMKERKEIDAVMQEYDVQWLEKPTGVQVKFSFASKNNKPIEAEIKLEETYPLSQPLIRFNLNQSHLALFNHDSFQSMDYYCGNTYTPRMTVASIIPQIAEYGRQHVKEANSIVKDEIFNLMHTIVGSLGKPLTIIFIIMFASLIRILVGLGPYSGFNDAPTFGDYEAQRHWMELTLHTPATQWYTETIHNDLTYWRIDYPPLSAYVSYLFGYVSDLLDPKSMELFHSRGYEEPTHKMFMRLSVLVSDIVFFFSSVIAVMCLEMKKYSFTLKSLMSLLGLLSPPFILIDHAHFQYNGFMHGLVLWAVYCCSRGNLVVGGILFSLALNFKQMGLYYSLGFFAYILGYLAIASGFRRETSNRIGQLNMNAIVYYAIRIGVVGAGVIGTFVVMWLPWLSNKHLFESLISAIFPVHRGLYQLKVANFWCFSNMLIKWTQILSQEKIILISVALTLLFCIPSMYVILLRPKFKYLKLALFNISMSFFFFSYHVHEKTILIPLVAMILCIRYFNKYYLDFVTISCLTLYPLLREDKQFLSWAVLTLVHHYFCSRTLSYLTSLQVIKADLLDRSSCLPVPKEDKQILLDSTTAKTIEKSLALLDYFYFTLVRKAIYSSAILALLAEPFVVPPANYPYLFSLIYAVIGFGAFAYITLASNLLMIHKFLQTSRKNKNRLRKQD